MLAVVIHVIIHALFAAVRSRPPQWKLTSHMSDPWDHHYQCENSGGRKHTEPPSGSEDRCIAAIRSRCADSTRTFRFLSRTERRTGKPSQQQQQQQLELSQEIFFCNPHLQHLQTQRHSECSNSKLEECRCRADNYWGTSDQQDVTHFRGRRGT